MREPEVLLADPPGRDRRAANCGTTFIADGTRVYIPATVVDIESFRRWADTEEFPEKGNIWWLRGEVWADMSKEQIFTHVLLKGELFRVLANMVKEHRLGMVLTDGAFLSNVPADISGKPDAMFLSAGTVDSGRVRFVEGAESGYVELEGSPDMVLEVVSDSSVDKDTVVLLDAYGKAGIPEYWLVDARGDQVRFDIYRNGPKGYRRSAKKHGWMASPVFGKSFRLTVKADKAGRPDYTLEVR